ncbi:Double-stranded RNA-specific editase 1 [Chionoecetes opilio]|uniref:Double-stranded RNA-specific editase 1 n=1 Tax=Chionoecetes opilio TaxID=41210 RepID=A0A8J4YAB7_CHIOP|nr:Double-stranded RNA-specific editase 1 [Chionoecetes opilio]
MRGRGRGRNWRSTPAPPPPPIDPVETFADNQSDNLEYYQEDMGNPDMLGSDMKEEDMTAEFDEDSTMADEQQAPSETRKRPWEKPGGVKVKRKKVPGAKNLKIRRYVQPKNAVMCLNELRPGVTYNTEQEGGVSQPFCVSVEVPGGKESPLTASLPQIDGQKYRGFGSSKQLAKQAAAEAALISFVKPPVATSENNEDDKTPWATLASFAIYKLFNDWREGRVGMCPPPSQPYGAAVPPGLKGFLNQAAGATGGSKEDSAQAAAFTEAICAHLGGRAPNTAVTDAKSSVTNKADPNFPLQSTEAVKVPNPAKAVPESAAAMHPVMVLHQMKPAVQYNVTQITRENKPFFSVSAEIDGKEFTGEGSNVKKAKFFLAKAAIQGLYDVESTFELAA